MIGPFVLAAVTVAGMVVPGGFKPTITIAAASAPIAIRGTATAVAVDVSETRTVNKQFVEFMLRDMTGRIVWTVWRSPLTFRGGSVRLVAAPQGVPAGLSAGHYTLGVRMYSASGLIEAQNNNLSSVTVQGDRGKAPRSR